MRIQMELIGNEKLQRTLSYLERGVFPTANARALNRSLTTIRTRTVRFVAKLMGVKQRDVRDAVRLTKANQTRQVATARFRGRAFNLIRFKARQTKKGVSASPWGKRRKYPHGFIATINGARVVMVRQKLGGARVGRLPIRPLLGPGIAKTAGEDAVKEERAEVMRTVYPVELERQLQVLTARAVRR